MQWEYDKTNFDRNLAVVIGIDRYKSHSIHDLRTPVSDARALADLLETEYGYEPENVVRLFDGAATLTGLQTLLDDTLPNQLKPTKGDRLIFYFAGHGIPRNGQDGPEGYLVPQDADSQKQDSFLPMSKLYDALKELECHHLLVILDCCFAGTFRWAGRREMILILETVRREHYDRFIRYPAWQVITSAAHDQEALDVAKLAQDKRGAVRDDKQELHSPFALALLSGLRENKADLIPDGVITAHELYLYLDQQVSQLSGSRQKPGIYPMRLEYDRGEFVFTKPGFTSEQLKPAPLLNESNNPYRGLASFDEKHANFFFGRKILVEELQHRLSQANRSLTVVLGVSGSGKSSLVKAGLIPELRQESKWYILDPIRPDRSPFTALARAILPIAQPELIEQVSQVSFLYEVFKPKEESGQDKGDESTDTAFVKLAEFWNSATREAKLLVVEDYFEQLLKRCRNPQEKEQLSQLYRAIFEQLESLSNRLQNEPQHLTSVIRKWIETHPDAKLLLTIDQFEELITMSQESQTETHGGDRQESDSPNETVGDRPAEPQSWLPFLEVLREAIVECPQQLHIVLTLRSDFEPRFLSSPLSAYWKDARFPVRAMNLDELREAIEGPALKQALYFEPPELVGKLIDEVGQMPGALPLLSFTLSELYIKLYDRWTKDKSTDRALRIKDYEELGGVARALTCRATQEYDNLVRDFGEASGKAYQATMQRVMLRMVTIEGGGVARRRVPESELVYPDAEENKRVAQVSDRLVKARLLVKGQETGEPYMEPAHDFLVRGWDKLQGWKSQEIENLFLQQRLTPQANDWVKYPQNTELLMRDGYRLSALEEILNSNSSWFNQFEAHFVQTSISYRDMPKKAKLIKDTKLERDERLIKSIHLFGENLDNFPTQIFPEVSSCLYNALEEKSFLLNKTQRPLSLTFHPNGQLLLASGTGRKNRIQMINLEDNSSISIFYDEYEPGKTTQEPGFITISPDGQKIVGIITQHTLWHPTEYILKMWDWQGNLINKFFLVEDDFHSPNSTLLGISALFAPNSETFAVLIRHKELVMNQILLLDNQGNLACEPILTESEEVSFSPDGKIIFDDKEQFWDLKGNRIHRSSLSAEFINLIQNPFCEPTYCQTVVSFEDESIKLWDLEGNLIHQFPFTVYQSKRSLALSPDGKLIAIGTRDGKVSLWDLKGNLLAEKTVSLNYEVSVIEFSPDGSWIACACTNERVNLLRGGNWQSWLKVACDELYNHPTLKNPEQVEDPNKPDIAVSACQVCQKYVWGNTSPQRNLDDY